MFRILQRTEDLRSDIRTPEREVLVDVRGPHLRRDPVYYVGHQSVTRTNGTSKDGDTYLSETVY